MKNGPNLPWPKFWKFHRCQRRPSGTAPPQPLPFKPSCLPASYQRSFSIQSLFLITIYSFIQHPKRLSTLQVVPCSIQNHLSSWSRSRSSISQTPSISVSRLNSYLLQSWRLDHLILARHRNCNNYHACLQVTVTTKIYSLLETSQNCSRHLISRSRSEDTAEVRLFLICRNIPTSRWVIWQLGFWFRCWLFRWHRQTRKTWKPKDSTASSSSSSGLSMKRSEFSVPFSWIKIQPVRLLKHCAKCEVSDITDVDYIKLKRAVFVNMSSSKQQGVLQSVIWSDGGFHFDDDHVSVLFFEIMFRFSANLE